MTNAQKRAAARLNQPMEVAGKIMSPICPATIDLMALTGHMAAVTQGYDPDKDGLRALWGITWIHAHLDDALDMEPDEINAHALSWGRTWDFEDVNQAAQWLNSQCEAIEKSIVTADPPKARRGRKAKRPTR